MGLMNSQQVAAYCGLGDQGCCIYCVRKVKDGSDRSTGSHFVSGIGVCIDTLTIAELQDLSLRRMGLEHQSLISPV